MPRFSARSLSRLDTTHPDLQRLFKRVVLRFDCSILEGVRTIEQQREYVQKGASHTLDSKHLKQSSGFAHAVDVAPWWAEKPHIRWPDEDKDLDVEELIERWRVWSAFVGYVRGVAESLEIDVRSGQDWDSDWRFNDHSFIDSPHWELI